ncbi:MAG TPA: rhomboid family intramembrane serine protease [Saprospiraceae bacterium]|nr:rhomboid family intramembrane serine protease [Saprospiraceae bacterium]
MENVNSPKIEWKRLTFPIGFLAIIWVVHLIKVLGGYDLGLYFGLKPLSVPRLSGILTSPLIHGDWGHLFGNTLSFAGLGFFLFYFYRKIALKSFFLIYLMTGVGVWLFGKNGFHIGASGIVYGMAALLFWIGIFRRNVRSIAISLVVLTLYSGMFYGLLPKEKISYESHIAGAIAGIFAAYYYKDDIEAEEEKREEVPEHPKKYFLPRDVFEKTKFERWQDLQKDQADDEL